jgi:hypothetical protein
MTSNRTRRAENLPARVPDIPSVVVARMQAHLREKDFPQRGLPATMQDFYARLHAAGLPPEMVTPEIYAVVGTSRSRLRVLLAGLRAFAPEVPLAPAAEATRRWDAWLNARYNAKPSKPRASPLQGLPIPDWPEAWQAALPALDRTVRPYGRPLRPLGQKTRAAVVSAVGLLAGSRTWATAHGVDVPDHPCADLFEAFERYLLLEREISFRTGGDYFERLQMFFLRAGLFNAEGLTALEEIVGALREAATDEMPRKRETLRAFRRRFQLGDILHRAVTLGEEADALPGHSTGALRRRQTAVAYALLVNAGDRQGDLRLARIGHEIVRTADGIWHHDLRQGKTGGRKEMEALWPGTCRLLDAHVLADRPAWQIGSRVLDLEGANLLTLSDTTLHKGFLNRRLEQDFQLEDEPNAKDEPKEKLSGHLIRTLIVDAIRRVRPDAMWAAQHMLGHAERTMHEVYRSEFAESEAIRRMDERLAEVESAPGGVW